ncbi:MAG: precorrin-4 C(11)-methyltransferase [Firmicutes bacterium]|nr:precorrin-4 C(11)-methyltransferase [Bacillota bacterium]
MVHFVGAGSGAEDLITVRGKRLIEEADTIIYAGSLVNAALLKHAKCECEIYNSAEMTLEEIVDVIRESEGMGKTTVRLHTGDPSLYGAIKEQCDSLDNLGIEYDICPGVSSMFGAAASLKIEYTIPYVSQSVIITRMEGRTAVPEKEKIELFAAHNATMVIFLSASMTGELSKRLIDGGYRPDTPCAIVYKATWEDEKKVICTVETLEESAVRENINKTAIIIVGNILNESGKRSSLYDAHFTTEYRQGI